MVEKSLLYVFGSDQSRRLGREQLDTDHGGEDSADEKEKTVTEPR